MSDAFNNFGLAHFLSQQGQGVSKTVKKGEKGMIEGSKVAGGEFRFYVGDVVQFSTLYRWCPDAELDADYTVVDDEKARSWNTCSYVNGKTKEICLQCVNNYWQDFMLVERSEPAETVAPVTVNVVINSDDPVDPKHSDFAEKIVKHIRDQYRPGGTLFYGDSKPYSTATVPNNGGYLRVPPSENKTDVHTGMIHTGKPRPADVPANPLLSVTDEQRAVLKKAVEKMAPKTADDYVLDAKKLLVNPGPIKSDGGSSSYYDLPIPDELMNKIFDRWDNGQAYIKTEEMIRYFFKNDFDFGTALKSLVRAHGTLNGGGKEGNDIVYETNKVQYYAKKIGEIHGKKDQ